MPKKYINHKKTLILSGKWIPYGAEAIIVEELPDSYKLVFKDINICKISKEEFKEYFRECGNASDNDLFEFNSSKNKIKKDFFVKSVKKYIKDKEIKEVLLLAINKAYLDVYSVPGSTRILNISRYRDFIDGKIKVSSLQDIGSPFFNRRARWSVIANVSKQEERGKPAPIGIRPEDYAPLKECNLIFLELIKQIFSMKDIPSIPKEIEDKLGVKIKPETHKCKYCGKVISILLFKDQKYKSKEHALNFCHIDPTKQVGKTNKDNVYIGHTSCNRIQGGLSEKHRIIDGLRLLELYRDKYKDDSEIKNKIKSFLKIV